MTSIDQCFNANHRDLMASAYTVEDAEFIKLAEESDNWKDFEDFKSYHNNQMK